MRGEASAAAAIALAAADGLCASSAVLMSSFMHVAERPGVVTVIMLPSGAIQSTVHGKPPSSTLVFASKKGAADLLTPLPAPPPTSVRRVDPKSCSCTGAVRAAGVAPHRDACCCC